MSEQQGKFSGLRRQELNTAREAIKRAAGIYAAGASSEIVLEELSSLRAVIDSESRRVAGIDDTPALAPSAVESTQAVDTYTSVVWGDGFIDNRGNL